MAIGRRIPAHRRPARFMRRAAPAPHAAARRRTLLQRVSSTVPVCGPGCVASGARGAHFLLSLALSPAARAEPVSPAAMADQAPTFDSFETLGVPPPEHSPLRFPFLFSCFSFFFFFFLRCSSCFVQRCMAGRSRTRRPMPAPCPSTRRPALSSTTGQPGGPHDARLSTNRKRKKKERKGNR